MMRVKMLIEKEIDAYKKAVAKNNRYHKAWYNLAIAYNKLQNTKEEVNAYLKAIEIKPEYPQALFNLAYAKQEQKDNANAIKFWKQYLSVAANIDEEQSFLVTAKAQLKKLDSTAGTADPKPADGDAKKEGPKTE